MGRLQSKLTEIKSNELLVKWDDSFCWEGKTGVPSEKPLGEESEPTN